LGIGHVRYCCILILLAAVPEIAAAQTVPLPPPRPALPAAPPAQATEAPAPPSACFLRLTPRLAIASALPGVNGAGGCGAEDVVRLEAVVLVDKTRVAVTPPAVVRCDLAEALARWVREDVAPAVRRLGPLQSIDNYASYECRGRNRVVGAKLSEHGKANALDMRSFKLANGKLVELTSLHVAKDLRENLKRTTCARFTTVLGPGSDGYHEDHVHVDLAERRGGYRMCQWDVREDNEKPAPGPDAVQVPLPRPRPFARIQG
jgi:hypothetical protein